MSDKIKFQTTIIDVSGSYYIRIPPQIMKHLKLSTDSDMKMQAESNDKHGRYASFWNEEIQDR